MGPTDPNQLRPCRSVHDFQDHRLAQDALVPSDAVHAHVQTSVDVVVGVVAGQTESHVAARRVPPQLHDLPCDLLFRLGLAVLDGRHHAAKHEQRERPPVPVQVT